MLHSDIKEQKFTTGIGRNYAILSVKHSVHKGFIIEFAVNHNVVRFGETLTNSIGTTHHPQPRREKEAKCHVSICIS